MSAVRPSTLGLAVLCLLEVGPLHPYGIQRLIRAWGKDKVINVAQRATLYQTIRRLDEAGLVSVRQTERDQQFPERTVYELTARGRETAYQWLADMLARPRAEYPAFPAALSFASLLGRERLLVLLEERATEVAERRDALAAELVSDPALPRIVLIEAEYQHAMDEAELAWLAAVADDLRGGRLDWSAEQLIAQARAGIDGSPG